MPKFAVTFNADVCKHPHSQESRDIYNKLNGILVCKTCGSQFPMRGNLNLWASGVSITGIQVKRA